MKTGIGVCDGCNEAVCLDCNPEALETCVGDHLLHCAECIGSCRECRRDRAADATSDAPSGALEDV